MQQLSAIRDIRFIVLHCSAGNQNNTAQQVQGFTMQMIKDNGYHVIVERKPKNDSITSGVIRMVSDDIKTSGIKQFRDKRGTLLNNSNSIHICWVGGLLSDKLGNVIRDNNRNVWNGYKGNFIATDNRSDYQKDMLKRIVLYYAKNLPNARFLGHNQISPDIKSCPNFDVREFCEQLGVPKHQIYYPDNFGVVEKLPLILKKNVF
jgi:N-acetylmuramoyl-L-alanine amidase